MLSVTDGVELAGTTVTVTDDETVRPLESVAEAV
jgi:hypothetical protein